MLHDFGHAYYIVCLGIYHALEALIPFLFEELKLARLILPYMAFLPLLLLKEDK